MCCTSSRTTHRCRLYSCSKASSNHRVKHALGPKLQPAFVSQATCTRVLHAYNALYQGCCREGLLDPVLASPSQYSPMRLLAIDYHPGPMQPHRTLHPHDLQSSPGPFLLLQRKPTLGHHCCPLLGQHQTQLLQSCFQWSGCCYCHCPLLLAMGTLPLTISHWEAWQICTHN
jgi:hypothetical protein